jgi:hypothetical protein
MSGVVESAADLLYLRDFTADDAVPPTPPPNVDGPAAAQETIDALLTSPFFPSAVDSNQRSLLHVAAALGLGNMVKLLLRGGAPVDRPDRAGMTPVDVALSKGHQRVLAVIADVAARAEAQRQKYEGQGIPAVAAVLEVPVPLAPAPLPFTLVPARLLCLTGGAVCARLVQVCVVDRVAPDAAPSDGGTGIQPGDIIIKVCLDSAIDSTISVVLPLNVFPCRWATPASWTMRPGAASSTTTVRRRRRRRRRRLKLPSHSTCAPSFP